MSSGRFLDPLVLSSIRNFQLLAKTVVDGFMVGANRTGQIGAGLEFNQYRSYQPGDDLKMLDWKMYSRSDRYYVRESNVETAINIRFILDGSASMLYKEEISRFDYSRFLVASLIWLGEQQGDTTSLQIVSSEINKNVTASRGPRHIQHIMHELETVEAEKSFSNKNLLKLQSSTRSLIVIVSDLIEENNEWKTFIKDLVASKNEVICFQVIGMKELELDFTDDVLLEGLENNSKIEINRNWNRKGYKKQVDQYLKEWKDWMQDNSVFYQLVSMNEPLDSALMKFLKVRLKNNF